jgi:hypothetical protein
MPEGAGYNIPISLSAASTFSVPQTLLTPSYVVFGTGNRVGGDIEQSPQNINPATAVSSASQRDASASSSGSGVEGLIAGSGGVDTKTLLIAGSAIVIVALIIGAAIYFRK